MSSIQYNVGGEPACFIIEQHLNRFVEGQDVRNVELIWDQMYRSSLPYGRKGLPIHCISAIDLALWDLLGKYHNEPIYNLLGEQLTSIVQLLLLLLLLIRIFFCFHQVVKQSLPCLSTPPPFGTSSIKSQICYLPFDLIR